MADEEAHFQDLRVFPCEPKDYNTARCRLDKNTMIRLGLIVGAAIKIRTSCHFVFCSVWPLSCCSAEDQVVRFDSMVTRELVESTRNMFPKERETHFIRAPEDVIKLEPVEAISITVSLWLTNDSDTTGSHLPKENLEAQRTRKIKILLNGLTIEKECTIRVKQTRNSSRGILNSIAKVVIKNIETQNGKDCAVVTEKTKIRIDDVKVGNSSEEGAKFVLAGLDESVQMLQELLQYPLNYPESYGQLGLDCAKGILLQGAPGVGKTLLVRKVTADCGVKLVSMNGTDVFGPHAGESEENLRRVFEKARYASRFGPCVLFIDELDALCPKRGTSGNEEENRIVAQLLTLMDGLESRGRVVVIGATNRPNAIDPALRRPGRFDREVVIGVPNALQRLAILQAHSSSLHLSDDVNLTHLAETSVGYVGADMASLCQQAAFIALKRRFAAEEDASSGQDGDGTVHMSDFQLAMCHIVPSTHRGMEGIVHIQPIKWTDVGGLHDVKQALIQAIEWPLLYPEAFARMGLRRPRGVLLYGPPGCCKTTLVRAAASSCHCTFLALSCAQLYSPYVGDAERKIREIFLKARSTAPSILFLDELDSLASKRTNSLGVETRLLATLLNEMDGVGVSANIYGKEEGGDCDKMDDEPNTNKTNGDSQKGNEETNTLELARLKAQNIKDLILVAATNRPDAIDDALLRPGRIDRIIYVPPPDVEARLEILKVHTRASPLSADVDLGVVAGRTDMYSGADLENLCREAALYALEEYGMDVCSIDHKHFMKALDNLRPSLTLTQLEYYRSKQWK